MNAEPPSPHELEAQTLGKFQEYSRVLAARMAAWEESVRGREPPEHPTGPCRQPLPPSAGEGGYGGEEGAKSPMVCPKGLLNMHEADTRLPAQGQRRLVGLGKRGYGQGLTGRLKERAGVSS